MSSDRVINRIL